MILIGIGGGISVKLNRILLVLQSSLLIKKKKGYTHKVEAVEISTYLRPGLGLRAESAIAMMTYI